MRNCAAIFFLWCVTPFVVAAPITYQFSGVADFASGIFAGQGSSITGTFSFDDGLLDSTPTNASRYLFQNVTPVENQTLTPSFAASLTIGTATVSGQSTVAESLTGLLFLEDQWSPAGFSRPASSRDRVIFELRTGQPSGSRFFTLQAEESLSGGHAEGVALGSNNLIHDMDHAISILDNIDLSLFNVREARSRWTEVDDSGEFIGALNFTWTDLNRITPVPEPSSLALIGVGLLGLGLIRRRLHPGAARTAKAPAPTSP